MPRLVTTVDTGSEAFARNAAVNRALAETLRARVAEAALGGPKSARERHAARGKLLPRQRVERLIDIGSPFLEIGQLAACDLYGGEAPGAGLICGVGRIAGREAMIVANDATVKGRRLLPDHREEAPAGPGRSPPRTGWPASIWWTAAAPTCRTRPRCFPTAIISAHLLQPGADERAGIAQIACVMGSCTAGGAYVPAMSDETVIVRGQGTIFLAGPPLVKPRPVR